MKIGNKVVIGILMSAALTAGNTVLADEGENRAAYNAQRQAMAAVSANRDGVIQNVLSAYDAEIVSQGGDPYQLQATLESADSKTLYAVQQAMEGSADIATINDILEKN